MLGLLLGFPHPSDFVCVLYLYIYNFGIAKIPGDELEYGAIRHT